MKLNPLLLALLTCGFAVLLAGADARAQSPQNPIVITSAPYTITASGYYRLGNNINYSSTTGTIIQVNASNVTIDFNSFYIAGPVGNSTQTVTGISSNERSNLTITNGTIAYCYNGTNITGNGSANTNNVGHRIENMRVTYCYHDGLLILYAPSSRIANNQISQIGGYSGTTNTDAAGIEIFGAGVLTEDNIITNVTPTGNGTGRGIYGDPGSTHVRNSINSCTEGIHFGKYYNNLFNNCTTTVTSGTDAGQNN